MEEETRKYEEICEIITFFAVAYLALMIFAVMLEGLPRASG